MKKAVFTFETNTLALSAKRALSAAGIKSKIFKLTTERSNGCAYALEFDEVAYYRATLALKTEDIKYTLLKKEE